MLPVERTATIPRLTIDKDRPNIRVTIQGFDGQFGIGFIGSAAAVKEVGRLKWMPKVSCMIDPHPHISTTYLASQQCHAVHGGHRIACSIAKGAHGPACGQLDIEKAAILGLCCILLALTLGIQMLQSRNAMDGKVVKVEEGRVSEAREMEDEPRCSTCTTYRLQLTKTRSRLCSTQM